MGLRRASVVLAASACLLLSNAPAHADVPEQVEFNRDVRPILAAACFNCHGFDEAAREADLQLDDLESALADRGGYQAIVPGEPDESEAFLRIIIDEPRDRMPPAEHHYELSEHEIHILRAWIEQGAEYEDHWAFIKPERPELPAVENETWAANPIDRFVLARLEQEGLRPSEQADRRTLIRRVSLDLTGLPPTQDEVRAFVNDDQPDAYERLVDRLLASPRYGEHQAWVWMDAARYSDTSGYQADVTRTQWPWRDWVVDAINDNMPYDQFTIEQLAGDLLPDATRDQHLASAFNRNHMTNNEGGRVAEESRVDYVIDRVDTTSTIWLGLTMSCAQCHDHKYDPISMEEFYEFYAYFNNVDETGSIYLDGNAEPTMPFPTPEQEQQREQLQQQLASLEADLDAGLAATDADERQVWEQDLRERATARAFWSLLTLSDDAPPASAEGTTLTVEQGQIIHAGGENPLNDTYTVTVDLPAGTTTALRLEALTHPDFPEQGLARSGSGNFVLTGVEAAIGEQAVQIADAEADFHQGGHPPEHALDGNSQSGWAVWDGPGNHRDRAIVFRFDEPIELDEPGRLTLTLRHDSPHANHVLGRFRLLATAAESPAVELPHAPPADLIAAIEADDRDAAQQQRLDEAFDAHRRNLIQQQIDQVQADIRRLDDQIIQVMVMRDREERRPTYILQAGVWDQYGDEVGIGTPGALSPLPEDAPANRLGLARWLVDGENPLTARVTVNRYWQQYFGTGIVKTAEDFGVRADLPSHPQLLDWLAVEFVESGWDVKHMHRLIVTSAAYRQSSVHDSHLQRIDPENRLIARGPRHRLPSHVIRDQALKLAGLLVEQQGGPGVRPYQPPGIWEEVTFGQISYQQDTGEDLYRRSLYTFWRRIAAPTSFFDISDRTICTVTPALTNTPLHALVLMNDTAYVEAARAFAQRMIHEGGEDARDRLAWGFRQATARQPDAHELDILHQSLERTRSDFADRPEEAVELISVGEADRDESLDPVKHAAYAGVASIILNLDEVISKE